MLIRARQLSSQAAHSMGYITLNKYLKEFAGGMSTGIIKILQGGTIYFETDSKVNQLKARNTF
jgi:hypothetical protein